MKRFFLYLAAVVCLASCNNKDQLWMAPMSDIDSRVTYLEQLCMQMNTNISSMQTIIQALQERDYVTNVAEIKEGNEVIGYTISFAKNPSITIYKGNDGKDGRDGKDGIDGKDGKDGITPQISVAQDGGIYYWTLNGEWLLDANGNKLRVTGENGKDGKDGLDGKDGEDGQDGKDGADGLDGKDGEDGQDGKDGADGQDGITPKLKIENDYWYISYDNGNTWTQLGKAKGDKGDQGETGATGAAGKDGKDGVDGKDGKDGANGKDGKDGDNMFKSVTQDETYVYFTLADGSVIKIPNSGKYAELRLIDLGLPSGTKWANQNFFIDSDDIYGDKFAFGSLVPNIDKTEQIIINGHEIATGDSIASSEYDVVTMYFGAGWHIPTENEFNELITYCTRSVCYVQTFDGSFMEGVNFKSSINGRSIQLPLDILPKTGMALTTTTYEWKAYYETSTYNTNNYKLIKIKRSYDYSKAGYNEFISIENSNGTNPKLGLIRPVYKATTN